MPKTVLRKRTSKNRSRAARDPTADAVGKYATDAWSLAKRTAAGLNEIRKFINIETKYFDDNQYATSSQSGAFACLSLIPQGVDVSTRVGDSLRLQHLQMRGTFYIGTTTPASCRVIIFRDMANRGVAPTGSDLLAYSGSAWAAIAQTNWINDQERFSIMFDETVTLDSSNPTETLSYATSHKGHIRFRGTGSGAADQAEGSVWVAVFTDAAATPPTFRYSSRITYTDD